MKRRLVVYLLIIVALFILTKTDVYALSTKKFNYGEEVPEVGIFKEKNSSKAYNYCRHSAAEKNDCKDDMFYWNVCGNDCEPLCTYFSNNLKKESGIVYHPKIYITYNSGKYEVHWHGYGEKHHLLANYDEYYAVYGSTGTGPLVEISNGHSSGDDAYFSSSALDDLKNGKCPKYAYMDEGDGNTTFDGVRGSKAVCFDNGGGHCKGKNKWYNSNIRFYNKNKFNTAYTYLDEISNKELISERKKVKDLLQNSYEKWIKEMEESKNANTNLPGYCQENDLSEVKVKYFEFKKFSYTPKIDPHSVDNSIPSNAFMYFETIYDMIRLFNGESPIGNYYKDKNLLGQSKYTEEYSKEYDTIQKLYENAVSLCQEISSNVMSEEEANEYITQTTAEAENQRKTTENYKNTFSSSGIIKLNFSGRGDCLGLLGTETVELLKRIYNFMKYIAIILLLVLSTIDFVKATISQDKELLNKASKTAVIRLIICIVLFFLPTIIITILDIFNISEGCRIG